ncbi:hypothetical protein BC828DRAFT_384197 [Blastocladiella britannica]|nr:hypothetical protein BC828DRAFT_384197 [Blastocladiella britannica]
MKKRSIADIDLLVDWTLVLATRYTYTLAQALPLLNVLHPTHSTPRTQSAILRRHLRVRDLGFLGRTDLVDTLSEPTLAQLAAGAARAGRTAVLDWIRSKRPNCRALCVGETVIRAPRSGIPNDTVLALAVEHGQVSVLDWIESHNPGALVAHFDVMQWNATVHAQPRVLQWLKAYSDRHHYDLELSIDLPKAMTHMNRPASAATVIAALDFWKHAATAHPLVRQGHPIVPPIETLWRTTSDGTGGQVIAWWVRYLAEPDKPPPHPWPQQHTVAHLVIEAMARDGADPRDCLWWFRHGQQPTTRPPSVTVSRQLMTYVSRFSRADLLDGWWRSMVDPWAYPSPSSWSGAAAVSSVPVLEWWWAKLVDFEGVVDVSVFIGLNHKKRFVALDHIVKSEKATNVSLAGLQWWYAHRAELGIDVTLGYEVLSMLLQAHRNDVLAWYGFLADNVSMMPVQNLPICQPSDLVAAVLAGKFAFLGWHWQYSADRGLPCTSITVLITAVGGSSDTSVVPEPVALDYLWDKHVAATGDTPLSDGESVRAVLVAWSRGQLDVVRWWLAMHAVHGTAVPTANQLRACPITGYMRDEVEQWLQQHFDDLSP